MPSSVQKQDTKIDTNQCFPFSSSGSLGAANVAVLISDGPEEEAAAAAAESADALASTARAVPAVTDGDV